MNQICVWFHASCHPYTYASYLPISVINQLVLIILSLKGINPTLMELQIRLQNTTQRFHLVDKSLFEY